MINTRILTQEFDYHSPKTLQEVFHLFDKHGQKARVIAGGTDLLVQMKQEIIAPCVLISLNRIPELHLIENNKVVKLGAAATLNAALCYLKEEGRFPALTDALESLAKIQVRNMGTLGGNLCNASPAADTAPPLLAYEADVLVKGMGSERILSLDAFFVDVNKTALEHHEIVTEIQLGRQKKGTGGAFMKTKRVSADISKISCAVVVGRKGNTCHSIKIAFGAVAKTPIRIRVAEEALNGKKIDKNSLDQVGQLVMQKISPIGDIRSTAEYRKKMAKILFMDVFDLAWQRAKGSL